MKRYQISISDFVIRAVVSRNGERLLLIIHDIAEV